MLLSASQHDSLNFEILDRVLHVKSKMLLHQFFTSHSKLFVEYFFHFPLLTFQLNLQPLSVVVLVANYL